ncbi:hypothetical protein L5515_003399 [Caenorhabditis briggsae]|uniref:Uncharacterized protein n=1 Tax=Caenorhabditis briggsae TaxID=6238 RepID=A0AAE9EKH8_CAEBR|nr:hypothetical protein L5515_003399 [Caenorhabditis briggsae]
MNTFCGHDFKTVFLKTTVPLPEAQKKLFERILKKRAGILKVKNLSILGDVNLPLNLRLCVQNLNVKTDCNFREDDTIKQTRTLTFFNDLQKVLTADSFPLESLELDYNFSLSKGAPAKTVILIGQAFGIVASNIHRIYVKYCIMDSSNVIDLVKRWQMVKPEIGRHYSLEPQRSDTAIGASGMFPFGLCFPISRDKMLNVYMEIGKNKD